MARQEADRDDLLREATALHRRAEFAGAEVDELTVVGFKRNGSLSIYFGSETVYHFDAAGRLTRAFHAGRLYRTQRTSTGAETLAELTRVRTLAQTILQRRDLLPEQCEAFLQQAQARLADLLELVEQPETVPLRLIPPHDSLFCADLAAELHKVLATGVRLAPPFPGKR